MQMIGKMIYKIIGKIIAFVLSIIVTVMFVISNAVWLIPITWEHPAVILLRETAKNPWFLLVCAVAILLRLCAAQIFEREQFCDISVFALLTNGIFGAVTLLSAIISVLIPGFAVLIQANKAVYYVVLSVGIPTLFIFIWYGLSLALPEKSD